MNVFINYYKLKATNLSVYCQVSPSLNKVVNQSKSTLNEVFLYTDIFSITWLKPGDTYIHTSKDTIMVTITVAHGIIPVRVILFYVGN